MVSMVFGRLLRGGKYMFVFQYRDGHVLKVLFRRASGCRRLPSEERLWRDTFPLPRRHIVSGERITLTAIESVDVAKPWEKYPQYAGDIVVVFRVKEWDGYQQEEVVEETKEVVVVNERVADVLQFKGEEK